ncbi:MAG: hypothetical protein II969_13805 [Anaerolineaceae bacterium]|nr:hypothetical protein [Anaerolineaceae bacterium]
MACEKDGASCTKDLSKDKAYTFFIMQYKVVDGKKVYSAGVIFSNDCLPSGKRQSSG